MQLTLNLMIIVVTLAKSYYAVLIDRQVEVFTIARLGYSAIADAVRAFHFKNSIPFFN